MANPTSCLLIDKRQNSLAHKKSTSREGTLSLDCVKCHVLRDAVRNTHHTSFSNVVHPLRNATRAAWMWLLTWSFSAGVEQRVSLMDGPNGSYPVASLCKSENALPTSSTLPIVPTW